MNCCPHCQGADRFFNRKVAESDLNAYRRNGATGMTKRLLDTLTKAGVAGASLLDIGGGIGVIQHELIAAGASTITDVDASGAYLQIAQQEASKRGYSDRANYQHGDFVAVADQVEAADIVTLDRVLCCYPNVEALVRLSSAKAKRFYGVIYPRDTLLTKMMVPMLNTFFRFQGSPFRNFIHPSATVERIVSENGLRRIAHHNGYFWQVAVYGR